MKNYQPSPDLLREKVILVTGAGDGIGAVAAKIFAAYGATVVLLGRTVSKLEKVYDEIELSGGPQAAIYPLNLEGAGVKEYDDLALVIQSKLGRLNGILHNAAFTGDLTSIKLYDATLWQRVMQINLTAPFMLTQSCLALLQSSADPRIVFTTHRVKSAYWGAYGVAKAGIEQFMQILACEHSGDHRTIRINAIAPGEVKSPLLTRLFPGKDSRLYPGIESIMPAYLYLMGNDSNGLNGKILDGQGNILQ